LDIGVATPPGNIWFGVSCEDQRTADERIPLLLDTPAAVRFVSAEPLLGPIQFRQAWADYLSGWKTEGAHVCGGDAARCYRNCPEPVQVQTPALNWVIVGGESGPGYRLMDPQWAESIAEQCGDAGVALFVKQDSGSRPGTQGRLSADLWAFKEFPHPLPWGTPR